MSAETRELALRPEVETPDGPLAELTERERLFVNAYLGAANWNATHAARIAGYGHQTYDSLRWTGSDLLSKPHVQAVIKAKVESLAMQAGELLVRIGNEARMDSAIFAECYTINEDHRRVVDWDKVRELGVGPLIRKVLDTKWGERIEPVDTQRAKEMIGKALGLFTDRLKIEGKIDYDKLTDEQLEDLAAGKRPRGL